MTRHDFTGPTVSRACPTKHRGARAVRWLSNRGIIARYSVEDREVWAPVTKHGAEWTIRALVDALAAATTKVQS